MLQCSVSHVIRSEAALFSNQAFVGAFDVVSRRLALRAVLRAARLGPRAGSPATRCHTEIACPSARLRRLRAPDSAAGRMAIEAPTPPARAGRRRARSSVRLRREDAPVPGERIFSSAAPKTGFARAPRWVGARCASPRTSSLRSPRAGAGPARHPSAATGRVVDAIPHPLYFSTTPAGRTLASLAGWPVSRSARRWRNRSQH